MLKNKRQQKNILLLNIFKIACSDLPLNLALVFAEAVQKSVWVVVEDAAMESCFSGTSGSE